MNNFIENKYKDLNNKDLKKLFIEAVLNNNLEEVINISNILKGINDFAEKQQKALKIAIERELVEIVEYLLVKDNSECNTKATIKNAQAAASRKNTKILNLVLTNIFENQKLSKKERNEIRVKMLSYSVSKGQLETTKFLIESYIKDDKYYGFKSFFLSFGIKLFKKNHFLNSGEKKIESFGNHDEYAQINHLLRKALLSKNIDLVKYLLESKDLNVLLNLENKENQFLLHFAVEFSSLEVVEYLLKKKKNSHFLQNSEGLDIFKMAINKRGDDIISYLMKDLLIYNKEYLIENKDFIFKESIFNGDMKTLESLVELLGGNFDINMKLEQNELYKEQMTLLDLAYTNYNKEAVKYFLSFPDIELSNHALYDKEHNIFHYACESQDNDLIRHLLIEEKFSINEDLMLWLKGNNESNKVYEDVLKMINNITLYNSLNGDLSNKTKPQRRKI